MPSESLRRWNDVRIHALNEIEGAHESVGGSERGRRYATQQINYAYAAILSSQFQAFCRDLHSESVDYLVTCTRRGTNDALATSPHAPPECARTGHGSRADLFLFSALPVPEGGAH